ncbi:FadR/GntR family transcriptional regulator [Lactococcus petauri]
MNCNRKNLIDRVIKMIKTNEIVLDGRLPSERDLAALLGVSRTKLREALIALETLEIIEMRGKKGIALTNKTSGNIQNIVEWTDACPFEEIAEIMQIRLLIEPNLVALATARRTETDIQKLKYCLKELVQADGQKKPETAAYWNTVLHATILKIANNNILFSFYQHIFERMQKSCLQLRIEIMKNSPDFTNVILRQHFDIVEAIINQDGETGSQKCREHILHTISGLRLSNQIIPFS